MEECVFVPNYVDVRLAIEVPSANFVSINDID